MPTQVGIHDFSCRMQKGVDGGPSPAMTGKTVLMSHYFGRRV